MDEALSDAKTIHCLFKNDTTTSMIECSTGCFNVVKRVSRPANFLNNSLWSLQSVDDIVMAGCGPTQDECLSPAEMHTKYTIQNEFGAPPIIVPAELLAPTVLQTGCFAYHHPPKYSGPLKDDQLSCCCASSMCNSLENVLFWNDANPYHLFRIAEEPFRLKALKPVPPPSVSSGGKGELATILLASCSLIAILLIICVALILFRERLLRFGRRKSDSLPAIFFSKASNLGSNSDMPKPNNESGTDGATSALRTESEHPHNQTAQHLHRFNVPLNKPDNLPSVDKLKQVNDYLKSNHGAHAGSRKISIETDQHAESLLEPLLGAKNNGAVTASSFKSGRIARQKRDSEDSLTFSMQLPSVMRASDLTLVQRVAQGHLSNVWKSRVTNSDSTDCPFAVKIFTAQHKNTWANEVNVYSMLLASQHTNVLRYFASDMLLSPSTASEYWLMTEYHEAGSLCDFLRENTVTWPQMAGLMHCLLEGLAYLHSESTDERKQFVIAHRDLKSKNVLVRQDRNSCCIGDFGLALLLNSSKTMTSADIRSKVGTVRYMSGELIEGAIGSTTDTFLRIDVYACALVLWEILSRGDFYDTLCQYKLPFEDEVGLQPSIDDMKRVVVDLNQRPTINPDWIKYYQIKSIALTIEECWDVDLDARISSECAAARLRKIVANLSL